MRIIKAGAGVPYLTDTCYLCGTEFEYCVAEIKKHGTACVVECPLCGVRQRVVKPMVSAHESRLFDPLTLPENCHAKFFFNDLGDAHSCAVRISTAQPTSYLEGLAVELCAELYESFWSHYADAKSMPGISEIPKPQQKGQIQYPEKANAVISICAAGNETPFVRISFDSSGYFFGFEMNHYPGMGAPDGNDLYAKKFTSVVAQIVGKYTPTLYARKVYVADNVWLATKKDHNPTPSSE